MHPHVSVTETADAAAFLRAAATVIETQPVIHSVIATNALRLASAPAAGDARFYLLHRHDRLVAAAMHTPPHPPHLAFTDPECAVALADHLDVHGRVVTGVGGLRDGALAFAEHWCAERDLEPQVHVDLGIYDLPVEPALPWPVDGSMRVAEPQDRELVEGWMRDFRDEVSVDDARPEIDARQPLEDGRIGLWLAGDVPVAMCASSVPAGGVTRLSWVWTPPEHRGHGYASAVVARWSRREQERGHRCLLYTDLANPTSNAIYQALGYRRIGDSVTLRFEGPPSC
ncbi:GNAT family N-acetyltransferase [Arsenicicoccus dermatophilus]|uniref:GNAT family N-acetyltransferase n=1 Tax=Arsenicicoccus dermatophilus TaxID=1076331 RepID=UPI003916ED96